MTFRETSCPYCNKDTSGTLPFWDEYPCAECVKKHYHTVDGFIIKKKYKSLKEQFKEEI